MSLDIACHQSLAKIVHGVPILTSAVDQSYGESKLTASVQVVAILFRKLTKVAGNLFDSHVNSLPDCLLVGSREAGKPC